MSNSNFQKKSSWPYLPSREPSDSAGQWVASAATAQGSGNAFSRMPQRVQHLDSYDWPAVHGCGTVAQLAAADAATPPRYDPGAELTRLSRIGAGPIPSIQPANSGTVGSSRLPVNEPPSYQSANFSSQRFPVSYSSQVNPAPAGPSFASKPEPPAFNQRRNLNTDSRGVVQSASHNPHRRAREPATQTKEAKPAIQGSNRIPAGTERAVPTLPSTNYAKGKVQPAYAPPPRPFMPSQVDSPVRAGSPTVSSAAAPKVAASSKNSAMNAGVAGRSSSGHMPMVTAAQAATVPLPPQAETPPGPLPTPNVGASTKVYAVYAAGSTKLYGAASSTSGGVRHWLIQTDEPFPTQAVPEYRLEAAEIRIVPVEKFSARGTGRGPALFRQMEEPRSVNWKSIYRKGNRPREVLFCECQPDRYEATAPGHTGHGYLLRVS